MAMKGFTRNFKPLEILTEEQVEAIHKGALAVLEETGAVFLHDKALKLFKENGCRVDFEEKRVRFPPGLVEECLRKCPSSFHIKARDPKNDLIVGGNTVYYTDMPGMQIIDLDTWEPRPPTKKEYYEGAVVLDALENFHAFCCYTPYFGWEAVPSCMAIPEGQAVAIKASAKIGTACYAHDCEIFTIDMAKATGQEFWHYACFIALDVVHRASRSCF